MGLYPLSISSDIDQVLRDPLFPKDSPHHIRIAGRSLQPFRKRLPVRSGKVIDEPTNLGIQDYGNLGSGILRITVSPSGSGRFGGGSVGRTGRRLIRDLHCSGGMERRQVMASLSAIPGKALRLLFPGNRKGFLRLSGWNGSGRDGLRRSRFKSDTVSLSEGTGTDPIVRLEPPGIAVQAPNMNRKEMKRKIRKASKGNPLIHGIQGKNSAPLFIDPDNSDRHSIGILKY